MIIPGHKKTAVRHPVARGLRRQLFAFIKALWDAVVNHPQGEGLGNQDDFEHTIASNPSLGAPSEKQFHSRIKPFEKKPFAILPHLLRRLDGFRLWVQGEHLIRAHAEHDPFPGLDWRWGGR